MSQCTALGVLSTTWHHRHTMRLPGSRARSCSDRSLAEQMLKVRQTEASRTPAPLKNASIYLFTIYLPASLSSLCITLACLYCFLKSLPSLGSSKENVYIFTFRWQGPTQTSVSPCCWVNSESCTGAGNNGDTCSKALCQMPVCQAAEPCSLGSRLLPAVTLWILTAPYLLNGGIIIQNVPYTQGAAYMSDYRHYLLSSAPSKCPTEASCQQEDSCQLW